MAEIMLPGHGTYSDNIRAMSPAIPLAGTAPTIEMLPNPDFSFPRIPLADSMSPSPRNNRAHRRPMSVHMDSLKPRTTETSHRRGASMLPSFTFNATDATGLGADPSEPTQTSPARSAHKRNTSELVGGRGIGMAGAISASPTKSQPLAVPGRPSGHKSRASRVTLSSSDWSAVMTTAETQPRLSSSLPNTPLDGPHSSTADPNDVFGPLLHCEPARPPSRPRVEFSDNVQYIPRPLSTISSETGSSMSTVRGHSLNNSISSVLSLSSPSPPSSRARTPSLSTTLEDEPRSKTRPSFELSRRVEREGQWLKHGNSRDSLQRPTSQPSALPNKATPTTGKGRGTHAKHKSLSYALGLDRRRSEPAMRLLLHEPSRLSTLSLQDPEDPLSNDPLEQGGQFNTEQRSSSRRLKDWAVSKIARRGKEGGRPHSEYLAPSARPLYADASPVIEPASAETDLDAVFSMDVDPLPSVSAHAQRVAIETPVGASHSCSELPESDDSAAMLDLDAALGPFKTPHFDAQKPRRGLHSSRGTRDFFGPGGHYQPTPSHRRAESAPMLTPWDQVRTGTPPQPGMADVFEEEEEEEVARCGSTSSTQDEESRMGVQIVDSDVGANSSTPSLSLDDGLRIRHAAWEPERPSTAFSSMSSSLAMPMLDRRASSLIEDTIIEESSPVEPTIVQFDEEPRAHSLTKSSDSSETPTIIGGQAGMLPLPDGQPSLITPESYQTSAFSTPDFVRRQNSFDTSRVGTSASSIADNRTMSSCTTGEPTPDVRISVDDIPSLTSSRSTMLSTSHGNSSRRDISGLRTPSIASNMLDPTISYNRRRKRASIASLSQLVGAPFGSRPATGISESRPQTAATHLSSKEPKKKEHRLKKLMFWKSKHRQASTSTIS